MNTPFVYGRIADKENFTDRKEELEMLIQNFSGLVNTIIISPRRWSKTSLVNQVVIMSLIQTSSTSLFKTSLDNSVYFSPI